MYRDWRGVVYPKSLPARAWLSAYGQMFDTVEVNSTFYRLPSVETVESWARQAPDGFLFAVKLGAFGSHRMKLRDPESWLVNHVDRVRRLGPTAGPTLVQLPPRWRRDVPRLDAFLSAASPDLRWAVEVRDPSWLHDDVYDALHRHRAALCIHDLVPDHPWVVTTDWLYLRFHGPGAAEQRYVGRYGGRRLWRIADRLGQCLDEGRSAFVYFNNDFHGYAVDDARWLAQRLVTSRRDARQPRRAGTSAQRDER
jgi:uncharacterized protein YecE (DUF72 family)